MHAISAVFLVLLALGSALADEPGDSLRRARAAASAGNRAEAIRLASQAIEEAPTASAPYQLRAALYAAAGDHQRAIPDYDQVLKLDPADADAFDRRGSEHFMLGHVDDSIADFDRYIKLKPEQERRHWKRGISYYYAGRYEDGRRQFEGYQMVDDNDVENAVWRFLCMAHSQGMPTARQAILKIKDDRRVPMMQVYALYAGTAKVDDVLAAARGGSPPPEELNARLFYAHLYLGLYHEAAGNGAGAREHLAAAVNHKIGHYMWNVADVHHQILTAARRP